MGEYGYDDDTYDGYEADDAAEALDDAYLENPVEFIREVVGQTASQVRDEISAQVAHEAQLAAAERSTANAREAEAAMVEKYGAGWAEQVPTVADEIKADAARGVLPVHDAQELARHLERTYLAERERSRPSEAEQARAAWERVRANGSPIDEYLGGLA